MANDFDKVISMINRATSFLTDSKTLKAIGKNTTKQIQKRTRLGKGVDKTGGPQTSLKIKPSTKKVRASLKKRGKLSGRTTPAKANVTRSGDTLSRLNFKTDRGSSSVTIKTHPADQKKVDNLDKIGIKFLNLTKGELKTLVRFLVKGILSKIK